MGKNKIAKLSSRPVEWWFLEWSINWTKTDGFNCLWQVSCVDVLDPIFLFLILMFFTTINWTVSLCSRGVHVTDFTSDCYHILTGSDDYTCRLWDIPNSTELTSYKEHTDYIRCGTTSKLNRDIFITGEMKHSYWYKDMFSEIIISHNCLYQPL